MLGGSGGDLFWGGVSPPSFNFLLQYSASCSYPGEPGVPDFSGNHLLGHRIDSDLAVGVRKGTCERRALALLCAPTVILVPSSPLHPKAVGLRFPNLLGPMVQITFPSVHSLPCYSGPQCQLPPTHLLLIFQTESIFRGQLSALSSFWPCEFPAPAMFLEVSKGSAIFQPDTSCCRGKRVAGLHVQAPPCAQTLVGVGVGLWRPTPWSPAGQRHRIVTGD